MRVESSVALVAIGAILMTAGVIARAHWQEAAGQQAARVVVVLDTAKGAIDVEVDERHAPRLSAGPT